MSNTVIGNALLASTIFVGASIVATPVFAQAAAQPVESQPDVVESETTGDIVVTGSRISRPNLEQASPVSVISQDEIDLAQPASAEEFLRDLPGSAPGINQQVNNGSNGTASFNLRNLGTNRNLVLLNSRRIVPSTLGNVVDLNIIPVGLIERADVFTGGASSVYGADAISGVVNFITRNDFAGVDISANYGFTERGDGPKRRLDLIIGANFDDNRGNVVLGLSHTKISPVLQGERSIGTFSRGSTCTAAQIAAATCADQTEGPRQGSPTAAPASLFFPLPATGPFAAGGQFSESGAILPGLSDYNFSPINLFQTPLDRYSAFASARFEVTDNIEVFSEGLYARSYVRQELAPTGTFTNAFRIPLNNQFLIPSARQQLFDFALAGGQLPAGTTFANAVAAGTEVNAIVARRFVEAGPRVAEYRSNVFNFTAGVRGKITSTLNFELSGQYGEADRRTTNSGGALSDRV